MLSKETSRIGPSPVQPMRIALWFERRTQFAKTSRPQGRTVRICSWCVRTMSASSCASMRQSLTVTSRQPPKWRPSPFGNSRWQAMRTPRHCTRSQSRNHVLHPQGWWTRTSSKRTSRQPTKKTQRPVMFVWLMRCQRPSTRRWDASALPSIVPAPVIATFVCPTV